MKILITTDWFATGTNGVVTSVKNLWDALKSKGHEVRILTLSDGMKSYKEGDVYYIRSLPLDIVYPNVRMPMSYRHPLIRELIDWEPDIIHSQCEFFSFQFAQRIAKKTGAKLVHTYHTLYEQYVTYVIPAGGFGDNLVSTLSRKRLKGVEAVIAPTHKVEEALLGYGLDNTIYVVPSGISLEQHQKRITQEERLERRRALGIADDQIVLLNLGRLGAEKNLEELLNLFADALTKHENLVFLVVGDGPNRKNLEKQVKQLGIEDHVIFTGMVDPSEVHVYYQLGDVFVSASTSETQGLTYIEAAANGLPLLCRQDLCLKDVIRQGENGYEYEDASAFIEYMDMMLENPEWMENAGKRSEEIARTFDKDAFGDAVEAVYETVVE